MKILILNRTAAESFTEPYSEKELKQCCISIHSSQDEHAAIKFTSNVLYICFDDVSSIIDDTVLFNIDHAKRIVAFLLKNLDAGLLVIHCDAGLSRSPAVGIAIDEFLNSSGSELYKKYPYYNRTVYHTLRKALYEPVA